MGTDDLIARMRSFLGDPTYNGTVPHPQAELFLGGAVVEAGVARAGSPQTVVPVNLMIDTGSDYSALTPQIIERLDLERTRETPIALMHEVGTAVWYRCDLFLGTAQWLNHEVFAREEHRDGCDGLMGRDLLSRCLLTWDGVRGSFSLRTAKRSPGMNAF